MCDQGCIWAYLACRTPPILTSTTKAKRETPLQPWPPLMWKWKLNKQQHQHRYNKKKRTTTGLIFFVYLFISWPTARRPLLSKQKQKRKRVEFHTNRSQGWNATLQLSFHASVTALRLTATRGDRWAGVGQSVFFFFLELWIEHPAQRNSRSPSAQGRRKNNYFRNSFIKHSSFGSLRG